MNNIPPFPPAERLGIALMGLIQAIAAQCGWWLPSWVIPKLEGEVRNLVEVLTLVAAEVAKRKAAAAEAADRRSSIKLPVAQKPPLPLWERVGERVRAASTPAPIVPLHQFRPTDLRATYGPKIPTLHKPAPWHAHFIPYS